MRYFLIISSLFLSNMLFGQQMVDSLLTVRSEKVLFDFGKFDLRPESDSLLNEVASFFLKDAERKIVITAHTDAIGTNAANLVLSQNRAKAVSEYLQEKGFQLRIFRLQYMEKISPQLEMMMKPGAS